MYSHSSEPFSLERDCEAILIPAGERTTLPVGTIGYITQSLGGSFTVYVDGHLLRVAGHDADALGKDPVAPPSVPENATESDIEDAVWAQLKTCYDPEIPINLVDLGLVYRCDIHTDDNGNREVSIDMTLTAPGCGMGDVLVEDARSKVALVPTVSRVIVELVFDPPWDRTMMSQEAQLQTGMMY